MADLAGVNGQRKDFAVVGKPNLPGKLSYALATGKAKFGIDYTAENMLFAKFLRSPHANATLIKVDTSAAKTIPGVVDIITWEDPDIKSLGGRGMGGGGGQRSGGAGGGQRGAGGAPGAAPGGAPAAGGAPRGAGAPAAPNAAMGGNAPAGPAFGPPAAGIGVPQGGAPAAGGAQRGGQGGGMMGGPGGGGGGYLSNVAEMEDQEVGVIVVAESEDICEEALRALKLEWEVRDPLVDLQVARKKEGNVTPANKVDGDVEAGFKEADQIIEFDFNMPAFSSHIPNPSGSIAWWFDDPYNSDGKSLHIEGAVQRKDSVGGMYQVPADRTVQEGLFQGGKYCDWGMRKSQEITPLLARRTGRPVRMANTRSEMYDMGMNQRLMHMKIGFKNNGLITAVQDNTIADNGIKGSSSFGSSGDQGYGPWYTTKCLNIKQNMEVVTTNRGKMYTSGQHCPFNWDNMTMAFHIIAEKLNMDVIDVALKNVHGPTSQKDDSLPPSLMACLESGKKLMNWNWHKTGAKKLADGRLHGASFRYQMCPRHAFSGYNCKLELKNGKVHMPTQGPCTGIYAVEGNAMVVAEELGLKYEDISIDFDYRETFTPVGGGSDGTTASAWATKECANLLKKQILEAAIQAADNPAPAGGGGGMGGGMMGGFGGGAAAPAAPSPLKGLKPADLDIRDGKIFVISDPSKSVPFTQATRGLNLLATFSGRPPTSLWSSGMGKQLDTMNIAMCEVAVDMETGEVEILRFGVVADPGKIIRKTSLESQIHQVMDFSTGCQLLEDYYFDKSTGLKMNSNMFEYKKTSMLDMPRVDVNLLETRVGNAAYGSNGISHSLANTHLVICAIQNAIGKWVDPPATPDKVLKALGKA